jgi:hypothetical protein
MCISFILCINPPSPPLPHRSDAAYSLGALIQVALHLRTYLGSSVEAAKLELVWPKDMRAEKQGLSKAAPTGPLVLLAEWEDLGPPGPASAGSGVGSVEPLLTRFLALLQQLEHVRADTKVLRTPHGSPLKKEAAPSTVRRVGLQSPPISAPAKRSRRTKKEVSYEESSSSDHDDGDGDHGAGSGAKDDLVQR